MAVNTGDVKNRKQTTCKVWFKRSGGQYTDLGDVAKYKKADEKGYSDVKSAQKGFKRLTAKLLNNVGLMWAFTLNEQLTEVMRLLGLATKGADTVQGTATGATHTITAANIVKGATYFLASGGVDKRSVTVTAVTQTGSTPVKDVDYTIDEGSGAFTVLATGTIGTSNDLIITFNVAAVTYENYTSLKETRVTGDFRVHEYDQFSEAPRETHDFTGQCWISNQGESDGEKPSEVELMVLVTSATPASQKRLDS
jgi:hypothetical protein